MRHWAGDDLAASGILQPGLGALEGKDLGRVKDGLTREVRLVRTKMIWMEVLSVSKGSGPLCLFLLQEAMQMSDGSLLGDPRLTPLSKKPGIKWQRPRLTRQALMRCCLVKWILSSAAPQGSGRGGGGRARGGESVLSSV